MPILCGTDFSTAAQQAATTAALLAARLNEPLRLIHVLSAMGDGLVLGSPQDKLLDPIREKLAAEAERLRGLGAQVETDLLVGAPDEVLVEEAGKHGARFIVMGSLGRRSPTRWLLGSTADRTATEASQPVLVTRSADSLGPWLRGERPLRVMIGADFTSTTEAAARWALSLCEVGPCELHVAHVVWPPEAVGRYGIHGTGELVEVPEAARELLLRDLEDRLAFLKGTIEARYHICAGLGRTADHLIQLASREQVDLLVVGTHQRQGTERLRHGSVSRVVLRYAPMAVACVPAAPSVDLGPTPVFRKILAPTDLSENGNRATRLAYAALPNGGVVRLLHVVERSVTNPVYSLYAIGTVATREEQERQRRQLSEHLRTLIPSDAEERGILTEVEVVESTDPGVAIAQAAERFGADAICIGTHGRTGLASAILGSVAQEVFRRTQRPVLLSRRR